MNRNNTMDDSFERDKPWRPGDYPPPGPSWEETEPPASEHTGVPDGED
jgi:hypothetical protein